MNRRSPLLIALLLLAFTSQLLVNGSMTCGLEKFMGSPATQSHHDMSNMRMHDMADMNHQLHDHESQHHQPQQSSPLSSHNSIDCCKTMGHCLFGGCSLAAANQDNFFAFQKQNSQVVDFYLRNTPTQLVSPHFRPPIFG